MGFDCYFLELKMSEGWRKYQGTQMGLWTGWTQSWLGKETADWGFGSQQVQAPKIEPICQGVKTKAYRSLLAPTLSPVYKPSPITSR